MSDFSKNLKQLRKATGRTQDVLAEKLHVTRQTVSSWECGNSYPDLDILSQLCETLSVSPNDLLYSAGKRAAREPERLAPRIFYALSCFILLIGLLCGIRAGSSTYAPAPNTVAWCFLWRNAFPYWAAAVLFAAIFWGLSQILTLLWTLNDRE